MNLLDMFEGREPHQQAIDRLEQARIDHLKEKMDYYAQHGMAEQFKKAKEEHDSYFKVQDECMGYGGLGEEGIPGNVPADKIPGKEDLLKGRGRSYYESVEEGNPSKKVFKDKAGKPVGEIGIDPESSPGNGEWYVYHYGTGYSVVGFDSAAEAKRELMYVHKHPEAVEGHESTFNEAGIPGSVPTEKIPGKEDLLKGKGRSYYESTQKKNSKQIKEATDPKDPSGQIAVYNQASEIPIASKYVGDGQFKVTIKNKPYIATVGGFEIDNNNPGKLDSFYITDVTSGKTEHVIGGWNDPVAVAIFNNLRTTQLPALVDIYKQDMAFYDEHGWNTGNHPDRLQGLDKTVRSGYHAIPADRFVKSHQDMKKVTGQQDVDESSKSTDPAAERLLTKARREFPNARNDAEALAMKILNKEQDDVSRLDRVNDREDRMIEKLADLERNLQQQIDQLTPSTELDEKKLGQDRPKLGTGHDIGKSVKKFRAQRGLDEGQQLHVGDPIVVTGPNEFEGKTGEVAEFSPSGKFVVVNLYNHGEHSMHLSDVEYNQYADNQAEEDDWYDDQEDTMEGWSDAIVARRTGQPRTPYSVYIKGKKWKDFENDDHAEAVANKLRAKFKADGRDPSVITIAATDMLEGDTNAPYTPSPAKPFRSPRGFNKQGTGIGNRLADLNRKEWEEKKKKEQGVAEVKADSTGSWVVYGGSRVMKFKTHGGAKAYAEKNGGKVASSEFYADKIQKQGMAEAEGDFRAVIRKVMSKVHVDGGGGNLSYMIGLKAPTMDMLRDVYHDDIERMLAKAHPNELKKAAEELKAMYKKDVAEAETDYQKRRQRERDVDAGKPVAKQRPSKMTDYQKKRAQDKKDMELGESQDTSGVESAIIRRIMVAHTDLLKQFGPQKVMQAAEEVAYNVGDVDEIGTSDVSAYVHQVKQILGVPEELDEKWSQKYKSSINCANPKGFSQKAHCAGRKK